MVVREQICMTNNKCGTSNTNCFLIKRGEAYNIDCIDVITFSLHLTLSSCRRVIVVIVIIYHLAPKM